MNEGLDRRTADEPGELTIEHVLVETEGTPDECLLVPAASAPSDEATAWIVAQGRSFTDLESMR